MDSVKDFVGAIATGDNLDAEQHFKKRSCRKGW